MQAIEDFTEKQRGIGITGVEPGVALNGIQTRNDIDWINLANSKIQQDRI